MMLDTSAVPWTIGLGTSNRSTTPALLVVGSAHDGRKGANANPGQSLRRDKLKYRRQGFVGAVVQDVAEPQPSEPSCGKVRGDIGTHEPDIIEPVDLQDLRVGCPRFSPEAHRAGLGSMPATGRAVRPVEGVLVSKVGFGLGVAMVAFGKKLEPGHSNLAKKYDAI
jgi:hypothetical protein